MKNNLYKLNINSEDSSESLEMMVDEINFERLNHFYDIYELYSSIQDEEKRTFLGNKKDKVCRFCKKSDKEVKFKSDAHVISQFLGNKNLLSHFECDECNNLFGEYETSFSNFLGLSRSFTFGRLGDKKVPKYKDLKNGFEVFSHENGFKLNLEEDNTTVVINENNKSLKINTLRPSYIPIHIPKILIKMGLCMLHHADMELYETARRILISSEYDEQLIGNGQMNVVVYFIPGSPIYQTPSASLYKKKIDKETELCPYMQFVLNAANYSFQISLPFSKKDDFLIGKSANSPIYPLLIDNSYFEKYGQYQQSNIDFSSNQKKKEEKHSLTFSFESIKRNVNDN